jgi:hypothetical protein
MGSYFYHLPNSLLLALEPVLSKNLNKFVAKFGVKYGNLAGIGWKREHLLLSIWCKSAQWPHFKLLIMEGVQA